MRLNSSTAVLLHVVNMRPRKSSWMGRNSSWVLYGSYIYMCECFVCVSALVVFVVTLTTAVSCCTAIQSTSAVYLVRRSGYIRRDSVRGSHIVSIRTGLKSRLVWDWSAVIHTITFSKQEQATIVYVYIRTKMGRDLVYTTCSRISFHYYQTSYDTCRGTKLNVWLLIGSKFAKNSWKLRRQTKQNQVYLAFSSQTQVRCDAGQSQGSWRVICTWF